MNEDFVQYIGKHFLIDTEIKEEREFVLHADGFKRLGSHLPSYLWDESILLIKNGAIPIDFPKTRDEYDHRRLRTNCVAPGEPYYIDGKKYTLDIDGLYPEDDIENFYSFEEAVKLIRGPNTDKSITILARDMANNVVLQRSSACAGAAVIPGAAFGLTIIEGEMLMKISKIYGVNDSILSPKIIIGIILKYAGGITALKAAANTLSFIPGGGSIVAGGFAYTLGQAAIKFYESKFPNKIANEKLKPSEIEILRAAKKLYDGKIDADDIDNMADLI